jgi:hypothetical protein
MKIANAQLKIETTANLTQDNVNLAAVTNVGSRYLAKPSPTAVFVSRFLFSTSSQSVTLNAQTGVVTLSAVGVQQVVSRTITAASGVTTPGNLALTFTSAGMSGSPQAMSVPLNPSAHPTATAVATAIAAWINQNYLGITEKYIVTSKADRVIFTSIHALAFDGSASLAITAGLGVSAGGTTGSVSGTLGVLHQRQGPDGKDIYGDAWTADSGIITDVTAHVVTGSVSFGTCSRQLYNEQRLAWSDPFQRHALATENISSNASLTIVDVIAFCK